MPPLDRTTLRRVLVLLTKIAIPPYDYEFKTRRVDLTLTPDLRNKLASFGVENIDAADNGYRFTIKTATLLNRFRLGESDATITRLDTQTFRIKTYYRTRKKAFVTFEFILCALLALFLLIHPKASPTNLLLLPIILLNGHFDYWYYATRSSKSLKSFFLKLGENLKA